MRPTLLVTTAAVAMLLFPGEVLANGSSTVNGVVAVADQLGVRATNIATAEGSTISGPIATFTDSNRLRTAGDFAASVSWGDGTTSAGIVQGSAGNFSVSATHAYAEEGGYPINVNIHQGTDGSAATGAGHASIADARLSASGRRIDSGRSLAGVVATFVDADPGHQVSDYSVLIRWGDATQSAGTIAAQGGGFIVSGSHTYRHAGTFTITVAIGDIGGAHASATTTATVHG